MIDSVVRVDESIDIKSTNFDPRELSPTPGSLSLFPPGHRDATDLSDDFERTVDWLFPTEYPIH
jgi:hypothetical protein